MKDAGRDNISEKDIALGAYHLWEAAGRPHGRAVEHWLEAEARLHAGTNANSSSSSADEAAMAEQARALRYGLVLRA